MKRSDHLFLRNYSANKLNKYSEDKIVSKRLCRQVVILVQTLTQHCLHFGTTWPSHPQTAGPTVGMCIGAKAGTLIYSVSHTLVHMFICVWCCSYVLSINVYISAFFKKMFRILKEKKKVKSYLTKLS